MWLWLFILSLFGPAELLDCDIDIRPDQRGHGGIQ